MLGSSKLVAFVPTQDYKKARSFYEGVLGLGFVSEDRFALVVDAGGITVRITKVPDFRLHKYTILGWEVSQIEKMVSGLEEQGVQFERYGLPGQDERGIWTTPNGDKVAWFKDPDGNILSLSQHAS
ncbi:MAG: VOC family protein [Acidobacteriia bacterium]|nr:VOC family protein [Terriglobia bacterium]